MKISRRFNRKEGSSLVVVLIVTGVLGVALLAYISLVASNQRFVARDEAWNGAVPLAEAGVEEALAHLNRNYPSNLFHAGWDLDGGVFQRQRQIGDTAYHVSFAPANFTTIISTGYVRLPWNDRRLSRTVRVTALYTGVVNKAIFVKDALRMNGYTIRTDSFDSSDVNYSTPSGRYDPGQGKGSRRHRPAVRHSGRVQRR